MSEELLILVAYDTSKTDKSCAACAELNSDGTVKMLVGYVGNDADEVYKIISEQGYLGKHDDEIRADERNKVLEEVSNELAKYHNDICLANDPFNFIDRVLNNVQRRIGE